MIKWKLAGLLLVCGLQAQTVWAVDRETCLKNYAQAERELMQRVTEMSSQKHGGWVVMAGGAAVLPTCYKRSKSLVGGIACTLIGGVIGVVGYSWNETVNAQIRKTQDAATIMRVYAAIKDNRFESSDEVIGLMRDLRIDVRHEIYVRNNVVSFMEKGQLCDEFGVPNVSYEEFQSLVRPGDL